GDVSVWISFESNYFTIQSIDDLSIVLEGTYSFDGLNIVLEPFEWYTNYPSVIVLINNEI
ncbi:MAG: hypothetical protein LBV58_03160, partial [Acholeplasmatales bacterium]|nr:hypothetical protein [Acholeplasmatales bacterium]